MATKIKVEFKTDTKALDDAQSKLDKLKSSCEKSFNIKFGVTKGSVNSFLSEIKAKVKELDRKIDIKIGAKLTSSAKSNLQKEINQITKAAKNDKATSEAEKKSEIVNALKKYEIDLRNAMGKNISGKSLGAFADVEKEANRAAEAIKRIESSSEKASSVVKQLGYSMKDLNRQKEDLVTNLNYEVNKAGLKGAAKNLVKTETKKEDKVETIDKSTLVAGMKDLNNFLNKNANALSLQSVQDIIARYNELANVLNMVETEASEAGAALANLGGKADFTKNNKMLTDLAKIDIQNHGIDSKLNLNKLTEQASVLEQLYSKLSANPDLQTVVGTGRIDALKASLDVYKQGLADIEGSTIKAGQNFAKMGVDANQHLSNTKTLITEINNALSQQVTKGSKEYLGSYSKLEDMTKRIQNNLGKWTGMKKLEGMEQLEKYKDLLSQIQTLQKQMDTGAVSKGELATQMHSIRSEMVGLEKEILPAAQATESFGHKLQGLFEKFSSWYLVSRIAMTMYRGFKQMVTNVKELDAAMTELKKVTDETDSTYNKFFEQAKARTQSTGATLKDTINATADFARLGYNLEEASQMSDAALIYKNVGDGIADIGEASESIISTIKAFGEENVTAMEAVDKFNIIGNNFAVSSAGLGETMRRSASALASANNDINQSLALAAGANEIVQNPEKVGTALKTISMRLRSSKIDLQQAGEESDGAAASVSALRQSILDLTGTTGKPIDIMIDDKTFKSTYDIMKDISSVWDKMSDIDQAALLELITGKTQANVGAAILTNFDQVEKAYQTSLRSAGSATEENAKVLESINGKISLCQASFEGLSATVVNSDLFKGLIDGATTFLNILDKITSFAGLLPTALFAAGTAFRAWDLYKNKEANPGLGDKVFSQLNMNNANMLKNKVMSMLGIGSKNLTPVIEQSQTVQEQRIRDIVTQFKAANQAVEKTSNSMEQVVTSTDKVNESMSEAGAEIKTFSIKQKSLKSPVKSLSEGLDKVADASENVASNTNKIRMRDVADQFKATNQEVKQTSIVMNNAMDSMGKATSSTKGGLFGGVTNTLAGLGSGVLSAVKTGLTGAAAGLIINAGIGFIKNVAESLDKQKQYEISKSKLDESTSTLRNDISNYSNLDNLIAQYNSTTISAKEKLNIQAQINQLLRDEVGIVDFTAGGLRTVNAELRKKKLLLAQNNQESAINVLKDANKSLSDYQVSKNNLIDTKLDTGYGVADVKTLPNVMVQLKELNKQADELWQNGEQGTQKYTDIMGQVASLESYKATFAEASTEYISALADQQIILRNYDDAANQTASNYETVEKKMKSIAMNDKEIKKAIKNGVLSEDDVDEFIKNSLYKKLPQAAYEYQKEMQKAAEKERSLNADRIKRNEELASQNDHYMNGLYKWAKNSSDIFNVPEDKYEPYKRQKDDLVNNLNSIIANQEIFGKIQTLKDELGNLSPEGIMALTQESTELKKALDESGISAEYLSYILNNMNPDGSNLFDLITPEKLQLSQALQGSQALFNKVISPARKQYETAMSVQTKDDNFKSMAGALEVINKELEEGKVNSNEFWAAAEYLLGEDNLQKMGWNPEKIQTAINGMKFYFEDAESSGLGFAKALADISQNGNIELKDGTLLGTVEDLGNGQVKFDLTKLLGDPNILKKMSNEWNMSEAAILGCLQAMSNYGKISLTDVPALKDALVKNNAAIKGTAEETDKLVVSLPKMKEAFASIGAGKAELDESLALLKEEGHIILNASDDASVLAENLSKVGKESGVVKKEGGAFKVNQEEVAKFLYNMGFAEEEAQNVIDKMGKINGVEMTGSIENFASLWDELEDKKDPLIGVVDSLKDLVSALRELYGLDGPEKKNGTGQDRAEQYHKPVTQKPKDDSIWSEPLSVQRKREMEQAYSLVQKLSEGSSVGINADNALQVLDLLLDKSEKSNEAKEQLKKECKVLIDTDEAGSNTDKLRSKLQKLNYENEQEQEVKINTNKAQENVGETVKGVQSLKKEFNELQQKDGLSDGLIRGGQVKIDADTSEADAKIENTKEKKDNLNGSQATVKVNADTSEAESKIDNTKQQTNEISDSSVTVTADTADADSKIDNTKQKQAELDGATANLGIDVQVTEGNAMGLLDEILAKTNLVNAQKESLRQEVALAIGTEPAASNLSEVASIIQSCYSNLLSLNGQQAVTKIITEHIDKYITEGTPPKHANGTAGAQAGPTLVGERGPELVQSGNTAYLVGQSGPEIRNLRSGDRVYTHLETKKILGAYKGFAGTIGAMAGGGYVGGINMGKYQNGKYLPVFAGGSAIPAAGTNAASTIKSNQAAAQAAAAASSAAKQATEEAKKTESEFERLYKEHNHKVNMAAETMYDYIQWLDTAYQEALRNGEIELEDSYKYAEEVFNKLQEVFKDYLNDMQSEIDLRKPYAQQSKEIIKMYKEMQKQIETEMAAARKRGLDDNDSYIQELKKNWQSYKEAIEGIEKEKLEESKDSLEKLIDTRIDMLKKDYDNEKENNEKKLKNLKDYYDKQKEMLRDQKEEEDYLDEQAEKRKKVADLNSQIEKLKYDDSAAATKKRIELQQELLEAQKELDKFERDHAYDVAEKQIDKLYESEEKRIDKLNEDLEKKLETPKMLRDEAIDDLKHSDQNLYNAMIKYNQENGDGNDETIREAWETAYKAQLEYKALNDKYYKDINLFNATGYIVPEKDKYESQKPLLQPTQSPPAATAKKEAQLQPALTIGTHVRVKPGTRWYYTSYGDNPSGVAYDGPISYINWKGNHPINIGGDGWVRKEDIVGYATGTKNASWGLHGIDELGSETIFESKNGNKYRMFSGGEKVLNAKASEFLYNFANNGHKVLSALLSGRFTLPQFAGVGAGGVNITLGDINISGNATEKTVSEIRRAQREQMNDVLKFINRLGK